MPEVEVPRTIPLCNKCGERHWNVLSCEKAAEKRGNVIVQPFYRTVPDGFKEAGFGGNVNPASFGEMKLKGDPRK